MNKRDLYKKVLGRISGKTWIPVILIKLSEPNGRWHILVKNETGVPVWCQYLKKWKNEDIPAMITHTELCAEQVLNAASMKARIICDIDGDTIFLEENNHFTCYNCVSAFRSFFWHQFNNKEVMDFEQAGLE